MAPPGCCGTTARTTAHHDVFFVQVGGTDEAGTGTDNPEEPEDEEEAGDAPEYDSGDCAGRRARV
jgi:hypothetical protein